TRSFSSEKGLGAGLALPFTAGTLPFRDGCCDAAPSAAWPFTATPCEGRCVGVAPVALSEPPAATRSGERNASRRGGVRRSVGALVCKRGLLSRRKATAAGVAASKDFDAEGRSGGPGFADGFPGRRGACPADESAGPEAGSFPFTGTPSVTSRARLAAARGAG